MQRGEPPAASAPAGEAQSSAAPLHRDEPSRRAHEDDDMVRSLAKPLPPTPASAMPSRRPGPRKRERALAASLTGRVAERGHSEASTWASSPFLVTRSSRDQCDVVVPPRGPVAAPAPHGETSSQQLDAPLPTEPASRQQSHRRRSLSVPDLRARGRQQRQELPPVPFRSQSRARSIRSLVPPSLRSRKDPGSSSSSPCQHRTNGTPKSRYRVTGGFYASLMTPRPDVFLAGASSASEADSDISSEPDLIIQMPNSSSPAPSRPLRFVETRNRLRPCSSDDEAERSSMQRVLREMDESQAERAAWSDSAIRGVAYSLSARLAERDARRARRRLRQSSGEVRPRTRSRTASRRAAGGATDSETDSAPSWRADKGLFSRRTTPRRTPGRGRRSVTTQPLVLPGGPADSVPQESPPVPTSFQPFHFPGPRSSRSTSARASEDGPRTSLSQSLRRFARRPDSKVRASHSMSTLNEGAPRHVLGRPIRHVRQAASTSTTHSLPFAPPFTNAKGYWNDSLGECSGEAISTPQRFGSPGRKASVVSQNAFLTLPPHLHHLLRTPVDSGVPQSRPTADSFEQPFASPSARQAAELALLLAERLGEDSPASPQQTPQPARCPRSHPFAKAADLDTAPVDPMDAADALEHESTPRSISSDLPVFEDLSNLVRFHFDFQRTSRRI